MLEEQRKINVRPEERWASLAIGTMILLLTLRPRGAWGLLLALVGGEFVSRGLTGHCRVYNVFEYSSLPEHQQTISFAQQVAQADSTKEKDDVEVASEQSFPASDPPSFTA
jgi:uncharacterized membrane protein